jgi:hypothetical protein
MCEDISEASALFIEAGGNRSSPTTVTESRKYSICNSNRLETSQAADTVSRNTTPIGTEVNCLDDMIIPRGHVKLLLRGSLLNAQRTKPSLGYTHWGDVQEFSIDFSKQSHPYSIRNECIKTEGRYR